MKKKSQAGRSSRFPRNLKSIAADLACLGREFAGRGWVLGTSGNFSAVIGQDPLRVAITASQLDKSRLLPDQVLKVDASGAVVGGMGRPSNEALIHLAIVKARGAGAVLHTHSVWSTILSEAFAGQEQLVLRGFEMLKGLEGVQSHEHRECLPILENSQDMKALAMQVTELLNSRAEVHGFLLRRHGLYTWGANLAMAKRHVEILEFLLEVVGREHCAGQRG